MTRSIGALVPLTPPGWVAAGRHLLAGLELAAEAVDAELVVRDTAGDPQRAAAAVDELAGLGVAAVAGEYHSVVARAAAARADALGVPFLCSSAVLDALTEEPTDWVARIAPAQSRGWTAVSRTSCLARGTAGSPWRSRRASTGLRGSASCASTSLPAAARSSSSSRPPRSTGSSSTAPTALLLLTGTPEPATSIVRPSAAIRASPAVLIGAPAGQPELPEWMTALGEDGAAIPFLRYLPERLTPLGARVEAALRERLGQAPSFVAFEGYDTILALAQAGGGRFVVGRRRRGHPRADHVLPHPGISVWQWTWPPIQVVDRDPAQLDRSASCAPAERVATPA